MFFCLYAFISRGALPLSNYVNSLYDDAAHELQQYVTQNEIASTDANSLLTWAREKDGVGLGVIYAEGPVEAPQAPENGSESAESAADGPTEIDVTEDYLSEEENSGATYDIDHYYRIFFSDQQAVVYLYGNYGENLLAMLDLVAAAFAVVVVFLLFLAGIRKRIRYIGELESEIAAMGSGDLESPINVNGDDELGNLAEQLEGLRITLSAQIAAEERAQQANRDLVTALSHDLRTPLTSLLLYTQILKDGKYHSEAELRSYLERIHAGANHMKALSDELLRHFLVADKPVMRESMPETAPLGLVLGDVVASFASALEAAGFRFVVEGDLSEENLPVDGGKIERIFNNLLSNVLKYGSPSEPVVMTCASDDTLCRIGISNAVCSEASSGVEAGIGLRSVRSLMSEVGGLARVSQSNNTFTVELEFMHKSQ